MTPTVLRPLLELAAITLGAIPATRSARTYLTNHHQPTPQILTALDGATLLALPHTLTLVVRERPGAHLPRGPYLLAATLAAIALAN